MKTIGLLLALTFAPAAAGETQGLIQLRDPLDEPEFYCLDVPGFRDRVQLDAPLMAHTCKPNAPDETFTVRADGQLFMKAYNRCVQAKGEQLFLGPCSEEPLQRFTITTEGKIQLKSKDLCVAVAPGKGTPTGGPSHLRRDLMLTACGEVEPNLSIWNVPGTKP